MIPLVIKGYSGFSSCGGCSGSSNVPIDASVIISFVEPKKLENPEQPEKLCHERDHHIFRLT